MTVASGVTGGWLLGPRLVRGLAVLAAVAGLVLPVVVVKWATATSPLPEAPDAGELRPEMVVVPNGTYTIGSPESEGGRFSDERLHRVTLTRSFAIGVTEVTRAQYERVTGKAPSTDTSCGSDCPVTDVSWLDAVRYMNRLSELDPAVESCYEIDGEDVTWIDNCDGYRLPTEAEWEVAARATTDNRYAGTDDEAEVCVYGNVADLTAKNENPDWTTFECDDGFAGLAPVQSFQPNGFYLYDMTGNVREWVWDWYGDYGDNVTDPRGPQDGQFRVYRGGSFIGHPQIARVAYRYYDDSSYSDRYLGFRVARSLP